MLAGWGLATWVGGFAAGAGIGALLPCYIRCNSDDPGLQQAIAAGVAVASLATPVAVHIVNGRRGQLALSLGASAAIGAASIALGLHDFDSPAAGGALLISPLVQIGASVWLERQTTQSPSR